MTAVNIVGAAVPRKEGWDKVRERARYVDEMVPGMHTAHRRTMSRAAKSRRFLLIRMSTGAFCIRNAQDIPGE